MDIATGVIRVGARVLGRRPFCPGPQWPATRTTRSKFVFTDGLDVVASTIVDILHNGRDPSGVVCDDLLKVLCAEGVLFGTHEVWKKISVSEPHDQLLFRLASIIGAPEPVWRTGFGYDSWQHLGHEIRGWSTYYSGARRNTCVRDSRIESRAQSMFGFTSTGHGTVQVADTGCVDEDWFGPACDTVLEGAGVSSGFGIQEATRKVSDPVVLQGLLANQHLHGQATGVVFVWLFSPAVAMSWCHVVVCSCPSQARAPTKRFISSSVR